MGSPYGPVPPAPQWGDQPPPPPRRGSRTVLIVVGSVLAGLLVLGAGGYLAVRSLVGTAQRAGENVGESVLGKMRDGTYDEVWNMTSPEYRKVTTREQTLQLLQNIEKSLGRPQSWKLVGYERKLYAGTNGSINATIYTYDVTYAKGASKMAITMDSGQLMGFHIGGN